MAAAKHAHTSQTSSRARVRVSKYACIYMCVCVRARVHVSKYACIYMCVCVCARARVPVYSLSLFLWVCVRVCVCVSPSRPPTGAS